MPNPIAAKIVQSVKDEIKKQRKLLATAKAMDWIPPLPCCAQGSWYLNYWGRPACLLPFNRQLMATVEAAMLAAGWELKDQRTERECATGSSDPWVEWHKDGHLITFHFTPYMDGAICSRRPIGKTTQEVEVYEYACKPTSD